ncbi:ATP-binding protein [uncultured Alsobacter sp.]|uniref:sensor histidine kinase n=1 Tax=uncultured Alsobacter sp. TaxID=1748258 RepID=UPI0025F2C315|nr:ATP-binding protein [uncultured Alsobacter sp.]
MFDWLWTFLDSAPLAPHGQCLLWRSDLVLLHVISDFTIAVAYFSIPVVLVYFIRRRPDVGFGWVFWCFAAFILACGATHVMGIWTIWNPDYAGEGLLKAATAAASIATAGALWPLLPHALALPSPAQLRVMNGDLAARVSERDEALRRLEAESLERLETERLLRHAQKMEALGQMTAGVAHDFNNLLAVVTLNLERLGRDLSPERAEKARRTALEAARRAGDLTSQMLAYARQQPQAAAEVELNDFVQSLRPIAEGALGSERSLTFEPAEEPVHVFVDTAELTSAVINLVANARDATPAGGEVVIRVSRGVDEATLCVADDGTGMSPEVQARAFDPFFTTKQPGKGSGLGLSQVFGMSRSAGGRVDLVTREGDGTKVMMTFPLVEARGQPDA